MKTLIIDGKKQQMTFEEVLEQFTPAIHSELNKHKAVFNRVSEERDDLFQNAAIWLWKAYNNYDIETGNYFSTLAFYYIRKGVTEITENNNADKRVIIDKTVSYDAKLTSEDDDFSLANILPEKYDMEDEFLAEEMLQEFKDLLSQKEQVALQYILEGRFSTELADNAGISRQCTAARYRTVKSKFAKFQKGVL